MREPVSIRWIAKARRIETPRSYEYAMVYPQAGGYKAPLDRQEERLLLPNIRSEGFDRHGTIMRIEGLHALLSIAFSKNIMPKVPPAFVVRTYDKRFFAYSLKRLFDEYLRINVLALISLPNIG